MQRLIKLSSAAQPQGKEKKEGTEANMVGTEANR